VLVSDREELKRLIGLLRSSMSNRGGYRSSRGYRGSGGYRGSRYRGRGGYGYRPSRYSRQHDFRYGPEPKFAPKQERQSQYTGRPWSEPTQYREKERLVYDPDVKRLLEKIESHLRNETGTENRNLDEMDADDLLLKLEEKYDHEVHEKLLEKLLEEINEAEPELMSEDTDAQDKETDRTVGGTEASEDNVERKEDEIEDENHRIESDLSNESKVKVDDAEDDFLKDMSLENETEVLRDMEAEEELNKANPMESRPTELPETIETVGVESVQTEPIDVVVQIEAEDLSPLEAELYPDLIEPMEAEEAENVEGNNPI